MLSTTYFMNVSGYYSKLTNYMTTFGSLTRFYQECMPTIKCHYILDANASVLSHSCVMNIVNKYIKMEIFWFTNDVRLCV